MEELENAQAKEKNTKNEGIKENDSSESKFTRKSQETDDQLKTIQNKTVSSDQSKNSLTNLTDDAMDIEKVILRFRQIIHLYLCYLRIRLFIKAQDWKW